MRFNPTLGMLRATMFTAVFFALLLTSCNETTTLDIDSTEQQVKFGFQTVLENASGARIGASGDAEAVVITIEDQLGSEVLTLEELELFNFNGNFISQPISLLPGDYALTEYMVLNSEGEVIYTTPKEGAPKAYLVEDPLDIVFSVTKDAGTEVIPEVLSTEESVPEDFGYTTFSFEAIETFDFLIETFAYNEVSDSLLPTTSSLVVYSGTDTLFIGALGAEINQISVRDNYAEYSVLVEKLGYCVYDKTFTNEELKSYFSSQENGPLEIVLELSHLVFWNKLGSDQEVLNSEIGPDLEFSSFPREYVQGNFGGAVTLAPGNYSSGQRIYNLMLNDVDEVIDPEKGTISTWYYQVAAPVNFTHNAYRLFDGSFGLLSGIGLTVMHDAIYFDLQFAGDRILVNYDIANIPDGEWMHIGATWNREGIDDSGETMQLYINGEKVASTTDSTWGTIVGETADIAGGNDTEIGNKFYQDNLKVYSESITSFKDRFRE